MKLQNSTDWTDHFLRRMAAWCAKQIEMPVRVVRLGVFRNSCSAWGGRARYWTRSITVCVGSANKFPAPCDTHEEGEEFADRIECLVAVTAHELYHLAAHFVDEHKQKTRRGTKIHASSERATCAAEMRVLRAFRANRENLLVLWGKSVKTRATTAKPTAAEKRATKAVADLERWQRKLKLAQTKIRKLKTRVRYYERKQAAAKPAQGE